MPIEITMPQLSDTMSEGTLIKWHKREGEKVEAGQELADVETDKATMAMEAFDSGVLALQAVPEGTKVPVGELLAVLAVGDEKPEEIKKQFAGKRPESPPPAKPAKPANDASKPQAAPAGASSHDTELGRGNLEEGRAQSRRESVQDVPEHTSEALSREAAAVVGAKRGPEETAASGSRMRASPLARRMAASMGVDLNQLQGSGPGGRIVQHDILAAAEKRTTPETKPLKVAAPPAPRSGAPAVNLTPRVASGQTEVVALSKMRATIAQRLQNAKQTIPHFYETVDVDVEELSLLRSRLNKSLEKDGVRLSLADFIAKALAVALVSHPEINSHYDGKQITRFGDVNLGMAVALQDGLIVPVLRGVNHMGLREIRTRSADLVERARVLRLRQEEMSGATFTISNLGAYGIREFNAIINPPEVAILAIASADKRPVVVEGAVVPRTIMTLTLSADHRAVDGAAAADFLRTLKQLLEEPGMMLV